MHATSPRRHPLAAVVSHLSAGKAPTLLSAALLCLLGACAHQSPPNSEVHSFPEREAAKTAAEPLQPESPDAEPAAPEQQAAAKAKPFPIETFYTLLVAEVAGNREHYDLALANYYFQAERTQDAGVAARATRIARFLNARRAALRSARLWVDLEPESAEAQLAATAELTLAGELDDALRHAERAMELGGDAPLQSVAATAVANEELANRVLPEFQRLSTKFPDNHEVSLALAMVLRANSQNTEALQIVRNVQERDPALLDAPLLESHILIDMGRPKEARKLLENLVDLYPKESRIRLQYARLLIREDLDLAQQQFEELVQQRPDDGNLILSLALIHYETGQLQKAKPLLRHLLALEEHESAAYFYLGGIDEQGGDIEGAVTNYRMVRPGGDYVQAITRGTTLLTANGKIEEADIWL